MTTAVALLRVSTPDQLLGLEAQRADIQRYASTRDIEIIGWHTEIISGGSDFEDRTGLHNACAELAEKRARFLVVSKRDRLSRDPLTCMLTERSLAKLGASVLAADGNNDNDPASELLRHILDAVAQFERRMIGIRTKAALAALRASGKRLGRPPGIVEAGPRKTRSDKGKARTWS